MSNTATIPDTYNPSSNFSFYRLADGKLKTGSDTKGTLETTDRIHGRLERIGIHESTLDSGQEVRRLECELELPSGGKAIVSASLAGNVTPYMLAKYLLGCRKGDVIGISPAQSKLPTAHGSFLTFVNIDRFDERTGWQRVDPVEFEGETSASKLPLALEALEKHEAWGKRTPKSAAAAGDVPWAAFDDAVLAKGWPSVGSAETQYLPMLSKLLGKGYASIRDIPAPEWEQAVTAVKAVKKIPAALQEVLDKQSPSDEDYNPFEDE